MPRSARTLRCRRLSDAPGGGASPARYPKLQRYVTTAEADAFVAWIARVAVILEDPADIPSVTRDPNDDYLFALALGADADVVVTGDADLTLVATPPVRVISPRSFLETLRT